MQIKTQLEKILSQVDSILDNFLFATLINSKIFVTIIDIPSMLLYGNTENPSEELLSIRNRSPWGMDNK